MADWMNALLRGLGAVTPWASALALALLLVRRLAKGRVPARAWRLVWLVLALRLALPVDISLPRAPVQMTLPPALAQRETAAPRQEMAGVDVSAAGAEALPGAVGEGVPAPAPPGQTRAPAADTPAARPAAQVDWAALLALAWAAGAAGYLLVQLGIYAAFLSGLRRSRRPVGERAVLAAAQAAFGGALPIYESGRAASPMLVGLLRPALYLPEGLPRQALCYILPHEARHRRAWDVPYQFLLTLAQAVQWYNPVMHLLARRARADMELACDEAVLRGRDAAYRQAYGAAVLDTLKAQRRRGVLCTGFAGGKRTLKERFVQMLDTGEKRGGKALCALALALVLALSTLVACAAGGDPAASGGSGVGDGASAASGEVPDAGAAGAETARTLLARIFTAPNEEYRDTSWALDAAMGVRPFDDDARAEAEKAGEAFLASVAAIMDGVAAEDQLDGSSRVWIAIQEVQMPFLTGGDRLEPVEITLEPTASPSIFTYHVNALLTLEDGGTQELAFTGNIQLDEDGLVDFMILGGDGARVLSELHKPQPPVWPVPAYTYTVRGYTQEHQALDIAAAAGAEIVSVRSGTVTAAAQDEKLGNYVVIDDGAGRVYTYAHCGELLVEERAFVACGQRIATVGSTGQASGNQLHLAVTQDGEPVDPMQELADVMPAGNALRQEIETHKEKAEEYQRLAEASEGDAARKHYEAYAAQEAEKMKQAQEEWAAWAASDTDAAYWDGGEFMWPLPGYTALSMDHGIERTIYGVKDVHRGMDIPAPEGTPVYAACDGVVSTEAHWAYGTCVKLSVNSEMALLYGHLSARYVEDGDVVIRGQKIGAVGSTGNATGEHLHFELDVNGSPASVRPYLDPEIEKNLTLPE